MIQYDSYSGLTGLRHSLIPVTPTEGSILFLTLANTMEQILCREADSYSTS
jgi:hypothetical protein